ncbi:MAG TPA: ParB/Srx family N-terminal domain-containing protein [Salinarimonas sp.]|nr:ParB/Srx family N-terminal domain-containing protein [Salinarimonas sp.]
MNTSPQIEHLPLEALKPYERNARTHKKKQVRQIARSIERFGFNNPVLIDHGNRIIAGDGRVEAARLIKRTNVPVLRLSHLSAADKRAYILADNRLAEKAGWDKEILALELGELVALDYQIELQGFETGEVDRVLEEAADVKGAGDRAEDHVPSTPERAFVVTRAGDLWQLGAHRLICGSALCKADMAALLGGELAQIVP